MKNETHFTLNFYALGLLKVMLSGGVFQEKYKSWLHFYRFCCIGCCVMSNSSEIPWIVSHQAHLSMGFPRQEYWSGLPFPSPGDLPDLIELKSPALQADSLLLSSQGSPPVSGPLGHFHALFSCSLLSHSVQQAKPALNSLRVTNSSEVPGCYWPNCAPNSPVEALTPTWLCSEIRISGANRRQMNHKRGGPGPRGSMASSHGCVCVCVCVCRMKTQREATIYKPGSWFPPQMELPSSWIPNSWLEQRDSAEPWWSETRCFSKTKALNCLLVRGDTSPFLRHFEKTSALLPCIFYLSF